MQDLTLVHSSDLHIDGGRVTESFHPLCRVLETAKRLEADILLLAGDIFDSNRTTPAVVDRVARLLDDARMPIVLLPGNHDCLGTGSVYEHQALSDVANVHVLGTDCGESVIFPVFQLEIWGRAHSDYADMFPLARLPCAGATRRVVMAHGHWLRTESDPHRGWLFSSEDIAATGADYVALGHWPQPCAAGDGRVPAFYSGSPDLAQTVNLVKLTGSAPASARRVPLWPVD